MLFLKLRELLLKIPNQSETEFHFFLCLKIFVFILFGFISFHFLFVCFVFCFVLYSLFLFFFSSCFRYFFDIFFLLQSNPYEIF